MFSTLCPGARALAAAFAFAAGAVILPPPVAAALSGPYAHSDRIAAIVGHVVDDATGQPVPAALVRLVERGQTTLTDNAGNFRFESIPEGPVALSVTRLGYAPFSLSVELDEGADQRVEVRLIPSALEIAGIVATGSARARAADEAFQSTAVVEGAELRRRLTTSLAATLAGEPGLSERYNGPVASQPVIRGLAGDRVLVLEDGERTGDIASSAPDHAVTIDPLTAERIEVVRGPSGLLYGSNAIGGVINVVREDVPRAVPESPTLVVNVQGESVNRGGVGGAALEGGRGHLAARIDGSGRAAGDTRTPLGDLPSTDLGGYTAGAGASYVGAKGFLGAAIRDYGIRYGIPGTFQGQTIPGAHDDGVDIDLRRSTGRVDGAYFPAGSAFHAVDLSGSYTRYEQNELEPGPSGPIIGTRFGQLTGTGRIVAHHHHDTGANQLEGSIGLSGRWKDFAAAGDNTGTRPANELNFAGFAFEEFAFGATRLQAGGRLDWTRINPADTSSTRVLRNVRSRSIAAVSASIAALHEVAEGVSLGGSVARSFRPPAVEELFSDGPHLASYSFEIGNPDLKAEFGLGTEAIFRVVRPRISGEFALFRNSLTDFIFYAPTGRLDPRLHRYPVYQATQSDAVMTGAEGEIDSEVLPGLVLSARSSYVRGIRGDDDDALPAIPPLNGEFAARLERPSFFLRAGLRWAGDQTHTAEFEDPTDGYRLLDLSGGLRLAYGAHLQTVTLTVENATDAVWRDHLSRIRAVAPQPGRNARILVRLEL